MILGLDLLPFGWIISTSAPNPNFPRWVDSSSSTRCSPPVSSSVFGGEPLSHKVPLSSAHEARDSASLSVRISQAIPELPGSAERIVRMPESTAAGSNPSLRVSSACFKSGNTGTIPAAGAVSSTIFQLPRTHRWRARQRQQRGQRRPVLLRFGRVALLQCLGEATVEHFQAHLGGSVGFGPLRSSESSFALSAGSTILRVLACGPSLRPGRSSGAGGAPTRPPEAAGKALSASGGIPCFHWSYPRSRSLPFPHRRHAQLHDARSSAGSQPQRY